MKIRMPFDYSAWIWCNQRPRADEYGEFYTTFDYKGESAVTAFVSADSNYAVYVNGRLAAQGQYADYPYDKVYDELDITNYCKHGKNHLAIVVWYYGLKECSTYYLGRACLRFAVWDGARCVAISGIDTQCRQSLTYRQHANKILTSQLGQSFSYNAVAEDGWMMGKGEDMHDSVLVPVAPKLRERPCKRTEIEAPVDGREIKRLDDGSILYDLGREECGLLSLRLKSTKVQRIVISYGEHIIDGRVRRKIGSRDFSVEYVAKVGENEYVNPFRRLACRYLEIQAEDASAIKVEEISILPVMYPLTEQTPPPMTAVQQRIYEACVRTLRLCMHEHYEDCPWREQSLYAMDSRNQILCGYYAFGEYEFPRANLELIAKDNRPDGLLAICYPSSFGLAIPSFSLHFITEAYEYLQYTNDVKFLREIFPKMQSVVGVFLGMAKEGVLPSFVEGGKPRYWNFYEWRPGLSGSLKKGSDPDVEPNLILNCLLLCALDKMSRVADEAAAYLKLMDEYTPTIRAQFWDAERGVFRNRADMEDYSQLGNALAILSGLTDGEEAEALAERIVSDEQMTPVSVSMQCFVFDALLKVSEEYSAFILEYIEKTYLPMLEGGTGTVWETEIGAADFGRAGSLCHGWSALPIYYYHKFFTAE